MKKIFTLVAAAVMALSVNAKDYTDALSVTLNASGSETTFPVQQFTISVTEQTDGKYTLSLKNFSLAGLINVGTIEIDDIEAAEINGASLFSANETVTIKDGDDPNINWTMKDTPVPIDMVGKIVDEKLYAIININLDDAMKVNVEFGSGYQLPNSGFEEFHKATYTSGKDEYSSDEPNGWHSFNSGVFIKGEEFLGSMTEYALHYGSTSESDEVRPGSKGKKSALLKSSIVIIQPANGTMTTGRMQAGSTTATDPANCAYLDCAKTDTDGNGDPFYAVLNGKPDALNVWVRFKQGGDAKDYNNGEYKYATVSAVITDGTYYQDPEDKEYTNVVAKAQNKTIESNDFAWQQLTIPFDYDTYASNNADAKALLVTISTNAQPGVGSSDEKNPDELYVDDIALVYNAGLESLKIKGTDVALEEGKTDYEVSGLTGELSLDDVVAVSDGRGAMVTKTIEAVDGGALVTVKVTSNDLKTVNTWTVNVKGVSTGIDKVETTTENGVQAIYTIDGRQVNTMDAKGIYIVRKADGTTVKVLKK